MSRFWNKSRLTALALIGIAAAPLVVATWLYHSGFRPAGNTNEGVLLDPIWDGQLTEWQGVESLKLDDVRFETWMLGVIPGDQTDNLMYTARQTIVALGRDAERMTHLRLSNGEISEPELAQIKLDYPDAQMVSLELPPLLDGLIERGAPESIRSNGGLILIDPLGNLVLVYTHDQTGKELLKDFKRLLKASKIG